MNISPESAPTLWGMKFSVRRRKVKLGHFYCQERRGGGGFNSLNFNWIEIIFSLPLTARTLLSIVRKKGKYFSLKYIVPSIFYCYRNKSIWSWSKFLQQFYFLSSPRLHMKSFLLLKDKFVEESSLSWLPALNTFILFVYFLFCVMDPVMPLKYFKRICPSYYNA